MRHLSPRRRARGMALAEVVMVTVISGLLFTVLPGFYFTYVRLWSREGSRMASLDQAGIVLQRMEKEVRNARRLSVSSDGKSLTIILPKQRYDAILGREVNDTGSEGQLTDGSQVSYYFVAAGSAPALGGAIHRRVVRPDGGATTPSLVSDGIHPELNPLLASGAAQPVFLYDAALRTVTVTVTAISTKASTGTLAPVEEGPRCARDGGDLVRVATASNPQGAIRCRICGSQVKPNAELVVSQLQLLARNE